MVREYRSPEVVNDAAALATLASAPVTVRHPAQAVDASTWKAVSVGHVETPLVCDDGWVTAPVVVSDAAALDLVEQGGPLDVSCGFFASYDNTPGVTPEGEPYDRRVVSMGYNHLAILPLGEPGRVAGASLVLDSAEVLEEVLDAMAPGELDNAPPPDTSTQPGEAPLTEAQAKTMIAAAVQGTAEALQALQSTVADLAAQITAVATAKAEPPEPEEPEPPEPPQEQPAPEPPPPPAPPVEDASQAPPEGKAPPVVEDSLTGEERIAQAEARAAVAEARAAEAERAHAEALAALPRLVEERRLVLDAAQALGLPVEGDTRALKLAVVRRQFPGFTGGSDLVVDAHFEAFRRVGPAQAASAAFAAGPVTTPAPAVVEPSPRDKFLAEQAKRGPR